MPDIGKDRLNVVSVMLFSFVVNRIFSQKVVEDEYSGYLCNPVISTGTVADNLLATSQLTGE
jgi:hypothetical protein